MGIRKYTWVKFPNHKWVEMIHFTPNKPYRVLEIREKGSAICLHDNQGSLVSLKMNSVIKCTPAETRLAILFE